MSRAVLRVVSYLSSNHDHKRNIMVEVLTCPTITRGSRILAASPQLGLVLKVSERPRQKSPCEDLATR